MRFNNERGCFGGGSPKAPSPTPTPPPEPTPTPTPTDVNPVATADDRAKRLAQLQYGLASTIRGGQGMTGTGANLSAPRITGVSALGA